MEISRKADYALRIMVELAESGDNPVSTRYLAETTDAPYAFIAKIVAELATHGFVVSTRGRGGGVKLIVDPRMTTALAVLEAVSGPLKLNNCVDEPGACSRSPFCSLCMAFTDAQRRLEEALAVNLLSLAAEQKRRLAALGAPG